MTEVLHRKEFEFTQKEHAQLKLTVVRGLKRVTKGPLLFSGFSSEAIQNDEYAYPYKSFFAVSEREWNTAISYFLNDDNPLFYAETAADELSASPAVGAYDAKLIRAVEDDLNYTTVQNVSIAAACLRVVVWDLP